MRDSKETYKAISETFCNIVNGRELLNEIDFAKGPNEAGIFDRGDGLDLELAGDTPDSRAKALARAQDAHTKDAHAKSVAKKDAIVKQFNKHRTRILANSPAPPVPEGPVTSGSLTVTPKSSSSRGMLSKLGSIAQSVAKNPFVRLGGKALGVVSAVAAPVGVYYDAQAMADLDTETTFAPYKKGKLPTFADRWRTFKRMGGM